MNVEELIKCNKLMREDDMPEDYEYLETKEEHRRGSNFFMQDFYRHKPTGTYVECSYIWDPEYGGDDFASYYIVERKEKVVTETSYKRSKKKE